MRLAEKPVVRPAEKPAVRLAEKPVVRPVVKPAERPVNLRIRKSGIFTISSIIPEINVL